MQIEEIRRAIQAGFRINTWQQSESNGAHNYIDVFVKNPNRAQVANAKIVLALDNNNEGRSIRFYVYLSFPLGIPQNMQQEFLDAKPEPASDDAEAIRNNFSIRQIQNNVNAQNSAIAVHAIMNVDWQNLTLQVCRQRYVSNLRKCCKWLCQWVDNYITPHP